MFALTWGLQSFIQRRSDPSDENRIYPICLMSICEKTVEISELLRLTDIKKNRNRLYNDSKLCTQTRHFAPICGVKNMSKNEKIRGFPHL